MASYVVAALLTWRMYVRRPVSAADMPAAKTKSKLARV
jgi:MFS transporter, NNP family, nitrate/nitrite transporter